MRRRFVYTSGGLPLSEPYEVTDDWRNPGSDTGHKSEEEVFGKLQATDGTDLSTRKRHRDYQRAHGLALADDYRDTWAKAEQRRADAFTGRSSDRGVRESLEKAIYKLTEGKRGRK